MRAVYLEPIMTPAPMTRAAPTMEPITIPAMAPPERLSSDEEVTVIVLLLVGGADGAVVGAAVGAEVGTPKSLQLQVGHVLALAVGHGHKNRVLSAAVPAA